jgi:osmotically-inducible protein OsmY
MSPSPSAGFVLPTARPSSFCRKRHQMKTDQQLEKDIIEELAWELGDHAKTIHSEAANGTVTLAGEVDIYAHKQRALYAAQRVAGIKSLAVHIDVKPRRTGAGRLLLTTF